MTRNSQLRSIIIFEAHTFKMKIQITDSLSSGENRNPRGVCFATKCTLQFIVFMTNTVLVSQRFRVIQDLF